jgi:Ca-activated chloride channel family protein
VSFDRPRLLLALFFLIPLLLASLIHYRRRRGVLDLFSREGKAPTRESLFLRYWLSSAAFLICYACLIVALAGPRQGFILVPDLRRGTDLVFALDLSRSMDARDGGGPSRLERAAAIARSLVEGENLRGGEPRWAAAVGKGSGLLAIPLTTDREALRNFLEGISTAAITGRGTNLESLIDAAAGAFKSGFPGKRRIILFSDGETLQGNLGAALERAVAADIAILSVGLGTEAGAPVPVAPGTVAPGTEAPGTGTPGTGERPVISRLDRAVLESAARRSGGVYINGMEEDAARVLRESLAKLGGGSGELRSGDEQGGFRRESRSIASAFILAAAAAFALSKLPGLRRKNFGIR